MVETFLAKGGPSEGGEVRGLGKVKVCGCQIGDLTVSKGVVPFRRAFPSVFAATVAVGGSLCCDQGKTEEEELVSRYSRSLLTYGQEV